MSKPATQRSLACDLLEERGIGRHAERGRVSTGVRPYLEALITNG